MNKPQKTSDIVADRSLYIGSSDASDIIAGNYSRLFDLKKGRIPPEDLEDNFKVQLGKLTEPFHLKWTTRRLNEGSPQPWESSMFTDKGEQHWSSYAPEGTFNSPVLGSHPDAIIRAEGRPEIFPMEVKHTGRFKSAQEAADFYMPQLQHHLLCWDADKLLFSVICGTEEPERIWIGYSAEYARYYIERCDTFWGFLASDIPPPAETYVKTPTIPSEIKNTIPYDGMKRRDVTGDNYIASLLPEYISTKKAAKRHEEVKADLKAQMGEDESALYADGFLMERNKKGSILFKTIDEEKWG